MIIHAARFAALALLLALPSVAFADDEPDILRNIVIVPRDGSNPPIATDQRPQQLGAKVLFVNFDGGDMNACGNGPQNNCSQIFNGTVLPYSGDAANRAAVIQVVRKRVEEFGLTITDQRPGSGDYDMEMVGNWEGSNPDFAGIAPGGDCWDNDGGETSFTLEVSTSADAIAEIMLQELAHTWGLDHVDEQQDLLFPTTQGTNKTFRDECYQIVSDTDLNPTQGFCSHHQEACGSNSRQNSHDEMMLIFGPSVPDTQAPLVGILSPENDATIDGGEFDLVIGLQDDQRPAVMNTTITISGPSLPEPIEADGAFASPTESLTFPISGIPDGDYTIRLEAFDESDNAATPAEIVITVVGSDVEPAEDDGADTSEGDGTQGDDEGDDDAGDDDEGDDDDGGSEATGVVGATGDNGPAQGCACIASDPTSVPATQGLVALLAIPAFARRRRRSC